MKNSFARSKIQFVFGLVLVFGKMSTVHAIESCHYVFDKLAQMSEGEQKAFLAEVRKAGRAFRATLRLPEVEVSKYLAEALLSKREKFRDEITVEDILKYDPESTEIAKRKLLLEYTKLARQLGRMPKIGDLAFALAIPVPELKFLVGEGGLYEKVEDLAKKAQREKPKAFVNVVDTHLFNQMRDDQMIEAIKNRKRMIITAAAAGSPVNKEFFQSLLVYARERDAEIIILPEHGKTEGLDPLLLTTPGVHICINSQKLSPYLSINNIRTMFKQVDNLAGIQRLGKRGESQIIAGAKILSATVPTVDGELFPHFTMTTGAVTEPYYNSDKFIPQRTNTFGVEEHRTAALILEKNPGDPSSPTSPFETQRGYYHHRYIEFSKRIGGFTDLDMEYYPGGSKKVRAGVVILGDVHVGVTDPFFLKALKPFLLRLRPKEIVLHDLFDGNSISHHEKDKFYNRLKKYESGELNLKDELREVVLFLNAMLAIDPTFQIRIIDSNHNSWLHRWLNERQFANELHNAEFGAELWRAMTLGEDPMEYALTALGLEYPKRVTFVNTSNFRRYGVQLGLHGHQSANGARGSLRGNQYVDDSIYQAHSHTTATINRAASVGTSTLLKHGYHATGPSSWSISAGQVTLGGIKQTIMFQEGTWWTDEKAPIDPNNFFFSGYPATVPLPDQKYGRQVDQWGGTHMIEFPQ